MTSAAVSFASGEQGIFESFQPKLLRSDFERYAEADGRIQLAAACLAKVTHWRWATGDMAYAHALKKPYMKELHRSDPKWLKSGATPKYDHMRHGLDAAGVVHVVCDPSFGTKEMNEAQGAWTYLVYGEQQIDAVTYRYTPGQLEHVRRCVYDGQKLTREHNLLAGNGAEQQYLWSGSRLDRILSKGWKQRFDSDSKSWTKFEVTGHSDKRLEFDSLGRLARVVGRTLNADGTVYAGLPERVSYERPTKSESIPALAKTIEALLLEQIPATVANTRPQGPFYCLLLCYCGEDFQAGWPPFLLLGSEMWRQRVLERGDKLIYLWAVGEMEGNAANLRLPLRDEVLNNTCRLHTQLLDVNGDYASALKMLRGVAKTLNEFDWSKLINVTSDFVVAAVDDHGEQDPIADIRAVVPSAKFKALRKQGLV